MTPLLRLFTFFWWLLVIGSAGFAILGLVFVWAAPVPPPGLVRIFLSAAILLLSLVPFGIMTVTRRIITGRWRLGLPW